MAIYNNKNSQWRIDPITKQRVFVGTVDKGPYTDSETMFNDFDMTKVPKSTIASVPASTNKSKTVVPPPPGDPKGLSLTGVANVLTGVNTAVGAAINIAGIARTNDMKPATVDYRGPIEMTHVQGNSQAQLSAGQENIEKSIYGAMAMDRRTGITGRNALYAGKAMESQNQLSAQIASMDAQREAINVGTDNQTKQFNAQQEMQAQQFNAQTANQYDMQKSSIIGANMSALQGGITQGVQSIIDNINYKNTLAAADDKNEYTRLSELYSNTTDIPTQLEIMKKLKALSTKRDPRIG